MRGQFVSYPSLIITDGLISYDGQAESFIVPDGTESISCETFSKLGRLVHITVPDSVKDIRDYTFKTCFNLVSLDLPAHVDHFGVSVFQMCRNLKTVILPDGIHTIEPGMFMCCDSLSSVTIPDSVIIVDKLAFSTCHALREIHINPDRIGILPEDHRITAAITYMNTVALANAGETAAPDPDSIINTYIRDNAVRIVEAAVDRNEKAAVSYMIAHDLIDDEHVPEMLALANRLHRTEITAMMLERNRSVQTVAADDPFDWDPFA